MRTTKGYHSTNDEDFAPQKFLHVGTIEQAIMRGGRYLYEIEFSRPLNPTRAKDNGDWSKKALARYSSKTQAVVYLNRHEGIPLEEFETARAKKDIDAIPDSMFRKLLPSAQDSWIIVDPEIVRGFRKVEKT